MLRTISSLLSELVIVGKQYYVVLQRFDVSFRLD